MSHMRRWRSASAVRVVLSGTALGGGTVCAEISRLKKGKRKRIPTAFNDLIAVSPEPIAD
jgi:hypothetical protein